MSKLVGAAKQAIDRLPHPLRLAAFVTLRGIARLVVPSYRKSANMYRMIGGPGQSVGGGPLCGMKYISCATGSTTLPKLLGTYEMELHDAIEKLFRYEPDLFVDIGSAEGYYVVGMATHFPQAKIVCYDTNPYARYLLNRLARRNGVSGQVIQKDACEPRELDEILAPAKRPALIIDVDGPEDQLLNLEQTPNLRRTWMIVELHDFLNAGVSDRIRARFESTHRIEVINSRDRTLADLPADVKLPAADALMAMDEARPAARKWFVMIPNDQT